MSAGLVVTAPSAVAAGVASVPRPDHVVIVVEENHSSAAILGNPAAPYINSLAASGANMTNFYAETHPSQPNYVAMYSGDTQGITDDSCPHTFATPNLGAQLTGAGLGFAGYSEGLPSVAYTGCISGRYARKHNPWSDFSNVPTSANQPFTAFPTDYSTLPAVSYVVPNLDDDMHDGTVAQGDMWLQNNLSGYVTWAQTHNSVFVLTFDEDDHSQANKIPTVITGQRVAPGSYAEQVNHYNLLRTLEDGYGLAGIGASATATPLLDIWTTPSGDQPPVAEFTTTCSGLTCSFDASPSSDPDGSIGSYSWAFGDGASGSGQTITHTYAGGGAESVTLTVSDNQGVTSSVVHTANPVATATSPFVADTFNRTVRNAWGSADAGGAWSTSGTTSSFTVDPGMGAMALSKAGISLVTWAGPSVTDADVSPVFAVNKLPVGGPVYVKVNGRRIDAKNYYSATVTVNADGSVTLNVSRTVAGTGSVLASTKITGLTVTGGMSLQIRLQVTGTAPTTLRARVWASSAAEPSTWRLSTTDGTAVLQAPGQTGLFGNLAAAVTNAPLALTFSGFTARPTSVAANQSPTAAFTSSCTQLSCTFDARSSSDPDGTISSYSWTFGDGATGSGATTTHAFVTANDYVVTLAVTDNAGSSASVSHTVTATNPPTNQPPTASFTSNCTELSCAFDGSGSSDPEDVVVAGYSWDFGDPADPSGATTATPSHVFATAGTYTAVRCSVGSATSSGALFPPPPNGAGVRATPTSPNYQVNVTYDNYSVTDLRQDQPVPLA